MKIHQYLSFVGYIEFAYIHIINIFTNPTVWKVRGRLERYTVMSKILNNTFSSIVFADDLNTAIINLFRAVVQLPSKIIALLYTWQTRMDDRKHIAELSDWQLKDLGLSRILADAESQKSFLIP